MGLSGTNQHGSSYVIGGMVGTVGTSQNHRERILVRRGDAVQHSLTSSSSTDGSEESYCPHCQGKYAHIDAEARQETSASLTNSAKSDSMRLSQISFPSASSEEKESPSAQSNVRGAKFKFKDETLGERLIKS